MKPVCKHQSIEHRTSAVFVAFWLVLPFREGKIIRFNYNDIIVQYLEFPTQKLYSFQNLSLGFRVKVFLQFRTLQPRYSCKTK